MNTEFEPCACAIGTGHLVTIKHPESPGETLCCSCTVAKYETLYGASHSFTVTSIKRGGGK